MMLLVSLWLDGLIFLTVTGPVQLSHSSTGTHPKQGSSQSGLCVPGEVMALFACFIFWLFDFRVFKKSQYYNSLHVLDFT